MSDPGTGVAHPSFRSASGGVRDGGTLHGLRWWPVTPAWWLAPVNVARSRRRRGWLAPVNSAPSPSSPLRRKVQRSRFRRPLPRVLLAWPRSRMLGGDGEVQCPAGVHGRGGQEHGAHGEPSVLSRQRAAPCTAEGPPTDAILTPVRFRRFQGHAATVCTVHAGTLPPSWCTVGGRDRATLHPAPLTVRLRRSSGTRNAWWFPSLRRSSGPLPPLATRPAAGRCGGAHGSVPVRLDGVWRRPVFQLRVRAEPRVSRRHAVVVELSLDGDVRTTMAGADYSRGPLPVGLSVGRTLRLGGYRGRAAGGT